MDANIDRWLAQFTAEAGPAKPSRKVETVKGIRVTRVSTEGTYSSGMPGGPRTPRTGFALLGAIAEGSGGNVFFKFTGPARTVKKAAPQFEALIHSLSQK